MRQKGLTKWYVIRKVRYLEKSKILLSIVSDFLTCPPFSTYGLVPENS